MDIMKKFRFPQGLGLFLLIMGYFLTLRPAAAQERVAMHPLRSTAEAEEMADLFYRRMLAVLPSSGDGTYGVFPISLTNLPEDVPEGGFPPWICPSPSITGASAFAITGEAAEDPDFPDSYRVRLYLWRMEGARLLGSDETVVRDASDLDLLPAFLGWVLSWIGEDPEPIVVYAEPEIIYIDNGGTYQERWLYLGLRGGGGYSRWTRDLGQPGLTSTHPVTSFMSADAAFQVSVRLSRFLDIQTEANLVYYFGTVQEMVGPGESGSYNALSLSLPLILKISLREPRINTGAFAGVYYYMPISQGGSARMQEEFQYTATFPGFLFGLTAGIKAGPGKIFLDGRFTYDGRWAHRADRREVFYRNSVRLGIGYEMGFFPKRR
ncbi:MAG: hypothetical protein FWH12_02775 [Treponema sp.]|nr:hypothetical protein [Treponema sp.]